MSSYYKNVIDELQNTIILRRNNDICIDWSIETKKIIMSGINCKDCGNYIHMKEYSKYPKYIFCYKFIIN